MSKTLRGTLRFLSLLYHSIVNDIKKSDGNALRGLFMEIMQIMVMLVIFYAMISILNLRGAAVRGNFILFLMTGIFLFMTHIKAVGKIAGSGNATNPMLKHAPVSTLLLIISAAFSALYIQFLAMGVILLIAHVLIEPIVFFDFKGFMMCFFIAWGSGASIGLVFLALMPFMPRIITIIKTVYQRANMIFSGKMVLANTMPGYILPMFLWNPLFHSIDQARGYTFINYSPKTTNLEYPLILTCVFLLLGMLLEHWARKYVSESWANRQ
ncbi:ABC transporter permease [Amylibacter sp. SFDW26]|uniref:ABC transporter permease n=1 Tax=Amylibacter sp. SFDW26 TaxID=2652722 RepID=UPI0012628042|nr:ABC transporter permease [Amylibacter sp. SFDW26]KAB7614549.1 ABC transporter permease [Amylibacter sp. SFDW26]